MLAAVPHQLGQGRKATGGKRKRCCSHGCSFQLTKKYNGSQVEIEIINLKYSSLNSNICNIPNIAEKLSEIFASLAANIFSRTIFLLAGKIHYLLSLLNLNIILQDPGTN